MKPSRAMGLFIGTWRADWARLSRAQLALLVSSQLPKPKAVTTDVVRKWESGQPPKGSAELEALCQVMSRHCVRKPEVEQFRQAVFAGCLDRHYPELWEDDGFVHRPDVDTACDALGLEAHRAGQEPNIVGLLARLHELRTIIGKRLQPGSGDTLERRQERAFVYLQDLLSGIHGPAGRWQAAQALCATRGEFLVFHFDGYLSGGHNVDRCRVGVRNVDAILGRGKPHIRWFADYSQREGRVELKWLRLNALTLAWMYAAQDPDQWERLQALEPWYWRSVEGAWEGFAAMGHFRLFKLAEARGCLADAEQHFEGMAAIRGLGPDYECDWLAAQGRLGWAAGNLASAQDYHEKALAVAVRHDLKGQANWYATVLAQLDRAQDEVRHRGKGRTVSSRRAEQ